MKLQSKLKVGVIMNFFQTYAKELVALSIPFITWILNYYWKAKANIVFANPHIFTFLIQEDQTDDQGNAIKRTQEVNTITHLIINNGKESAKKLEVTFNWKPMYLNMWPIRIHSEHEDKDGRYTLLFDTLAPNENINIELLSINRNLPHLLNVRSEQCTGKPIQLVSQPVISNWLRRVLVFMMLIGISASIYMAVTIVQFLVLKTPL